MALAGPIAWDVRTTGDDNNGGGFNRGTAGTDYSVQDSPQKSGTDLAIHATDNTKVQPVAAGVAAADVGNLVKLPGGGGFTAGTYEIRSQDGTYWTLDRGAGTIGSTGGTYKMGGGRATIASAVGDAVSTNEVHVKSGTYNLTSGVNPASKNIAFYGYGSSHGDMGTKPLVTTATNSINLLTTPGFGFRMSVANISFSSTAGTPGNGIQGAQGTLICSDCVFDGFNYGMELLSGAIDYLELYRVEAKNCTTDGVGAYVTTSRLALLCDCFLHDNGIGLHLNNTGGAVLIRNRIVNNTTIGVKQVPGDVNVVLIGNTIANNGTDGVEALGINQIHWVNYNNIFYGNGGYAINFTWGSSTTTGEYQPLRNGPNAYGSNTSGNFRTIGAGVNDVTLTADPFTNSATRDYTLNNVAGGGAACRDAALQG